MKNIVLKDICKSFGKTAVVKNLDMAIGSGEKIAILGPSGCGKSTILRMIAGLEDITSGELYLGGRKVNGVESGERNVSMVFQNYALFPHMTVEDNITYGLRANRVPTPEVGRRKSEVVKMLGLSGLERRKPRELSGGQRQRVALARAVAKRSNFLLLDEPLSNLDVQLREHARKELVKVHEKFGQTIVYVTHDQVEAMTLGDRIALLSEGVVKMLDTPQNVYNRPANVFTAKFIGSPSCNIVPAAREGNRVYIGKQSFPIGDAWRELLQEGRELYFGVRPENVKPRGVHCPGSIKGRVRYSENYGRNTSVFIEAEGEEFAALCEETDFCPGETAYMTFERRIHFFDRETGNSLGYPEEELGGDLYEHLYKYDIA
ncbi:MAG: ABC transporter ATP-binding protein [Synergistaceae bacterium]|nr:ABC transporter ATP-binding protein [Synergistaceae bacterium]